MERHVNTRNEHERTLTASGFSARSRVRRERLNSSDRAGNRVLGAGQVVVHDLQEFARRSCDLVDVRTDVLVADAELVGAQGSHPVVRAAVLIAFDQVVHRGAALVDDFEDLLQRENVRRCRERVVLAQRVASIVRPVHERVVGLQLLSLRVRKRGEGDLGELREVEDTLRMAQNFVTNAQFGRVFRDDRFNREAELTTRVMVGALPDFARHRSHVFHAHLGALDALTGVNVRGRGRGDQRATHGNDIAIDAARCLDDNVSTGDATYAFDRDFDLVVQIDHAVHLVRPRGDLHRRSLRTADASQLLRRVHTTNVCRGNRVLSNRGQPHSVHQRRLQTGQPRRRIRRVNRVVVARNIRKRGHVMRCPYLYISEDGARRVNHFNISKGGCRLRRNRGCDSASNGETLGELRELTIPIKQGHANGYDAAGAGFFQGFAVSLGFHTSTRVRVVTGQSDGLVQVNGVDQALDDRDVVVNRGSKSRVDGRPRRPHERIGNDVCQVGVQDSPGYRGVSVTQSIREREVSVYRSEALACNRAWHFGDVVTVYGGCGNTSSARKQVVGRVRQAGQIDHRVPARCTRVWNQDRNVDPAHCERRVLEFIPRGVAVNSNGYASLVLDNRRLGRHDVRRVVDEVSSPHHVGCGAEEFLGGLRAAES